MDYNHDCKKMLTQGQVARMTAALDLDSRVNLCSRENLIATGCLAADASINENAVDHTVSVIPNLASAFSNLT